MSVRAPVERRVNSVAGWCGTGGNAPLVFEAEGGLREIDAGNTLKCRPLSLLQPSHFDTHTEPCLSACLSLFVFLLLSRCIDNTLSAIDFK